MALTQLTTSSEDQERAAFALDFADARLSLGRESVHLNRKALAFVGLLTFARIRWDDGAKRSPWITVDEVAKLPEWTSQRLRASLESQIRRVIKTLAIRGIDIIEAKSVKVLKGPFRLKFSPDRKTCSLESLSKTFAPFSEPTQDQTSEALFQWLESATEVVRYAYLFDKREPDMSEFTDIASVHDHEGPTLSVMALITQTRGLRETGDYARADASIKRALVTLENEKNPFIRSYLKASCYLQRGWTNYRMERYRVADAAVKAALDVLSANTHLRVLGQVLTLRSLLWRRRKRFTEALDDLRSAAECWIVEADPYNLFSVYHNLSCLLSEQADSERNEESKHALLEQAIKCCRQSRAHCNGFGVGQNSVISTIQMASLYFQIGDLQNAKREADAAYKGAMEVANRYEVATAHHHRMKVRLRLGDFADADNLHVLFLKSLGMDHPERVALDNRFKAMRKEAVSKRKNQRH